MACFIDFHFNVFYYYFIRYNVKRNNLKRSEYMTTNKFSEPTLLILISLAEQNRHGYAIMEDIQSSYDVKLGPGTLYGAISRLEKAGYISPIESQDRKKPYKMTTEGEIYLTEQIKEIQKVTNIGMKRLGLV